EAEEDQIGADACARRLTDLEVHIPGPSDNCLLEELLKVGLRQVRVAQRTKVQLAIIHSRTACFCLPKRRPKVLRALPPLTAPPSPDEGVLPRRTPHRHLIQRPDRKFRALSEPPGRPLRTARCRLRSP